MKSYRLIMYFLFTFMAGFTYTALVYLNMWEPLKIGFQTLPWWAYFLTFFVAFYVALTIHELAHFISFKIQGIHLRAIYITIFVFYKTDRGWRFTINPKLWVLFGGLVIPDLDEITSDAKFDHHIHAFATSLLTAPLATIFYALILFISFFVTLVYATGPIFLTIFCIFTMFTMIISLIYVRSFSMSTQNIFGDFVAFDKVRKDPVFQLVQLIQYQKFSLKHHHFNPYLFEEASWMISRQQVLKPNLFMLSIISYYLEGVNYYDMPIHEGADKMIKSLNVRALKKDELGLMFSYELATYYYHTDQLDKSYQIYSLISKFNYKNIDDKLIIYLKNKYEHITYLEDHESFLADLSNVYIDHLWLFDKIINPYDQIEVLHKKQPYKVYECLVTIREDELEREMI